MFFLKKINGIVKSCEGCKEYILPRDYSSNCRFVLPEYRHELEHDDFCEYGEYFVSYRSVTISYDLDGEQHFMEFHDVTSPRRYRAGDSMELVFDKIKNVVRIKGGYSNGKV